MACYSTLYTSFHSTNNYYAEVQRENGTQYKIESLKTWERVWKDTLRTWEKWLNLLNDTRDELELFNLFVEQILIGILANFWTFT